MFDAISNLQESPIQQPKLHFRTEVATPRDVGTIIDLRNRAPKGSLRSLDGELIDSIGEFRLVIIETYTIVACFRIFDSTIQGMEGILELGSVSSNRKGCGPYITSQAEKIAKENQQKIIAVTTGRLARTLEGQGWKDVTGLFPDRLKQTTPDKTIYGYGFR